MNILLILQYIYDCEKTYPTILIITTSLVVVNPQFLSNPNCSYQRYYLQFNSDSIFLPLTVKKKKRNLA